MEKKKLVIFDFDGVLVDTLGLWYEINKKTNAHLTYEDFERMSHGNFYESYESENPIIQFTPNENARAEYAAGLHKYPTNNAIQSLIKKFSSRYLLAIVSSGSEDTMGDHLENENLLDHFVDVLGFQTSKSKTLKLNQLLEKYELTPADAVFVTDTLGDVLEAHEASIKSIAVLWGLHDRATLERGNPELVIDTPELLEESIEKVLQS